jgi:predicted RNA-binding protein with PUA-like domain
MKYWLVKSEPFKYSWDDFLNDGWTYWDGVRNYQARNNLQSMKTRDLVLFYHSNEGLEVMGIAEVIKEAYQDPTTDDGRWVAVDLKPKETFKKPVPLSEIKMDIRLREIALMKQTRLSVMPITKKEFETITSMGRGK